MTLELIPAVDIRGGRCVRLLQGDYGRETLYDENPVRAALGWRTQGAPRLHVVDLDGARSGLPVNRTVVLEIARSLPIPVEVGGGIRSLDTMASYLDSGVARVILGTAALEDADLLAKAARAWPGRVWVGIDARGGKVAVKGWLEQTGTDALDLARRSAALGAGGVIYTDISRDGMLSGHNVAETRRIVEGAGIPVIASGGVASIDDVRAIAALVPLGVEGAIVGKALYDGRLDLARAMAAANEPVEGRAD